MDQENFVARDYRNDEDYLVFDAKFRKADNLDYAVLLGHIMIEDQLKAVLAARLDTDTLPPRLTFSLIAGLALAGTKVKQKHLRETVGLLNTARNEVGHKMYRRKFHRSVESFVRTVKGNAGRRMTWPRDEDERIAQLQIAVRFFMVELALVTEYEERVHRLGIAAVGQ